MTPGGPAAGRRCSSWQVSPHSWVSGLNTFGEYVIREPKQSSRTARAAAIRFVERCRKQIVIGPGNAHPATLTE